MKIFVIDVDGVLTTGRKVYGSDGYPIYKEFFDKDFTALKDFTAHGWHCIWISGDDFVNKEVAANRNYSFLSARDKDKDQVLSHYLKCNNISPSRLIAVGDDIFDLSLLKMVDQFYMPANAYWRCKQFKESDRVQILNTIGGAGVITEIACIELGESDYESVAKRIRELDLKERF